MINECYEIDGISKSFIEWCNEYNRRPFIVRARMSSGMSLRDALKLIDNKRENVFCINGEYGTFQHWCKYYAISSSTVRMRIQKGYDLEHAFTSAVDLTCKLRKAKEYCVYGTLMTLSDLSKKYGINQSTIASRLRRGETITEALDIIETNRKKPHINDGRLTRYSMWEIDGESKTLISWCREYGFSYDCIKERLLDGYSISEALTMEKSNSIKRYFYKGDLLNIGELSLLLGIKKNTLRNWLNQGLSIQEIVEKADHLTEYRMVSRPGMHRINGEKLRLIRLNKHISQRLLSALLADRNCNLNRNAISHIECDKWLISDFELNSISDILDIDTSDLLR